MDNDGRLKIVTVTVPSHRVLQAGDRVLVEIEMDGDDPTVIGSSFMRVGKDPEKALQFTEAEWYEERGEERVPFVTPELMKSLDDAKYFRTQVDIFFDQLALLLDKYNDIR